MWFTWVTFAFKAVQTAVRDGTSLSTVQSAKFPHPLMVPCTKALILTFADQATSRATVAGLLPGKYGLVLALERVALHTTRMVTHGQVGIRRTGSLLRKWSRQLLNLTTKSF